MIIIMIIMVKSVCELKPINFQKSSNKHRSSFEYEIYRHRTSLSNYMWEIKKKQGIDPMLKWEIILKNAKNIRLVIDIIS